LKHCGEFSGYSDILRLKRRKRAYAGQQNGAAEGRDFTELMEAVNESVGALQRTVEVHGRNQTKKVKRRRLPNLLYTSISALNLSFEGCSFKLKSKICKIKTINLKHHQKNHLLQRS
jgi:hypothetical protein